MPQKKDFTPEQIKQIEDMSKVRLPVEQMASQLGISKKTFERRIKKNVAARDAMDKGRDSASRTIRTTLYQMAIGRKGDLEKGVLPLAPEFQAIKFWCQTQEGFKIADRLEHSGPDGKPIQIESLTKDQIEQELEKLRKRDSMTDGE